VGFGSFSLTHIVTLLLLAVAIAVLVVAYRRAPEPVRRRIRIAVGVAIAFLEVLHQAALLMRGTYDPTYLPLHLCGMMEFIVIVDCFHSSRWTREPLYAFGVWCAPCALLFPDWSTLPIFNLYTWQGFLIHACIVGYALMRLISGEVVPTWRNLWRVVVISAVFIAASVWANSTLGTDFWFLVAGSPGSPLEPIQAIAGQFYLPVLALMLLVLWAMMYTPWGLRARHLAATGQRPAGAISTSASTRSQTESRS